MTTIVTTSGEALETAARQIQELTRQVCDTRSHMGVSIRELATAAVKKVRAGQLGPARETLAALGDARHQAQRLVEEALRIIDRFGANTRTAIVS